MKQTKRQRAQCVTPCELIAGTKQQCKIYGAVHVCDSFHVQFPSMISPVMGLY